MPNIVTKAEVLLDLGLSVTITTEEDAIVDAAIQRAESAIIRHLHYDPVQRSRTEFLPLTDLTTGRREGIWEVQGSNAVITRTEVGASSELQVKHIPIRSITNLFVDYDGRSGTVSGSFAADTEKTEGVDFNPNYDTVDSSSNSMCRDGIIRSAGLWPTSPGTVKLVSVAGYTATEFHGTDDVVDASPITEAAVDESIRRAKKAFVNKKKTGIGFAAGPLSGERLGDYSYNIDSSVVNRLFAGTTDLLPETVLKLGAFVNYGFMMGS